MRNIYAWVRTGLVAIGLVAAAFPGYLGLGQIAGVRSGAGDALGSQWHGLALIAFSLLFLIAICLGLIGRKPKVVWGKRTVLLAALFVLPLIDFVVLLAQGFDPGFLPPFLLASLLCGGLIMLGILASWKASSREA